MSQAKAQTCTLQVAMHALMQSPDQINEQCLRKWILALLTPQKQRRSISAVSTFPMLRKDEAEPDENNFEDQKKKTTMN